MMEGLEDTWWYVCTICYRAFAEDSSKLKLHMGLVHDSRDTANTRILSQATDLEPRVKVPKLNRSGATSSSRAQPRHLESRRVRPSTTILQIKKRSADRKARARTERSVSVQCRLYSSSFTHPAQLKNHVLVVHAPDPVDSASTHNSVTEDSNGLAQDEDQKLFLSLERIQIQRLTPEELSREWDCQAHVLVKEDLACNIMSGQSGDEFDQKNLDVDPTATTTDYVLENENNDADHTENESLRDNGNDEERKNPAKAKQKRRASSGRRRRQLRSGKKSVCSAAFEPYCEEIAGCDSDDYDPRPLPCRYRCVVCCAPFGGHRAVIAHLALRHFDHVQAAKEGMPCECLPCYQHTYLRPSSFAHDVEVDVGNLYLWECKLCGGALTEAGIRIHVRRQHPEQQQQLPVPPSTSVKLVKSEPSEWRVAKLDAATAQAKSAAWKYKCPICGKIATSESNLRQHIDTHGSRDHLCSSCGAAFKSAILLKKHSRSHDDSNRTFVCEICFRTFFTKANLELHRATHKAPEVLCPDCGKLLKTNQALKIHQQLAHTGTNVFPFKCGKCDAKFKLQKTLYRHARAAHVEGRPHSCPQCPKAFKTEYHLKSHFRNVHSDRPKQVHTCRVCKQEFPGSSSVRHHELDVHNFQRGRTSYKCRFCDKKFPIPSRLLQHEVSHTGERKLKCEHPGCGKTFMLGTHLRTHKFIHLPYEELPLVCDVEDCGKRFGLPIQLRNHRRRIHEKEKA